MDEVTAEKSRTTRFPSIKAGNINCLRILPCRLFIFRKSLSSGFNIDLYVFGHVNLIFPAAVFLAGNCCTIDSKNLESLGRFS